VKPRRHPFFTGWEFKREVLRPLVTNVLTAAVLFAAAVTLKPWIYGLFSAPRVPDWPIYCVFEPQVGDGGKMIVDLFVANLRDVDYTQDDLEALAARRTLGEGPTVSSIIRVELKDSVSNQAIETVTPDEPFNTGKGRLEPRRVDDRHWTIDIQKISKSIIVKFEIHTTVARRITARGDVDAVPVRIVYARKP